MSKILWKELEFQMKRCPFCQDRLPDCLLPAVRMQIVMFLQRLTVLGWCLPKKMFEMGREFIELWISYLISDFLYEKVGAHQELCSELHAPANLILRDACAEDRFKGFAQLVFVKARQAS